MRYDVIVVGGGPAGLITAEEIAKAGFDVCVIEEHQEIGYPSKCSGLFSVSGLESLNLSLDPSIICTTIKGGRFYSPSGKEMLAYSDVERARVVERKLFDKFLAREAARAGVEIMLKTKVKEAKIRDKVSVDVKGIEGEANLESEILIGADGVRSNVAKWNGLKTPSKIVAAAQVEVDEADVEQDIAEVYFSREYAPNFYAWIMPKGEVYEVGVGVRDSEGKTPLQYLEKFMKEHPIAKKKITGKSVVEVNMGAIPVDYPGETVGERVMIVGDAAGHAKASTGGGVITGGIAARLAGRAGVRALEEGDFSEGFLRREYEERWREELGLELQVHAALRELFDSLTDEDLEYLFDLAIKEKVSDIMVKYQDTDRPSEFVRELLKNERMLDALQRFLDLRAVL